MSKHKPSLYLLGSMQFADDHGVGWREKVMELLGSDFDCWSPNHFEDETIRKAIEDGKLSDDVVRDLEKKNVWEVLRDYRINRQLGKHREIMSVIIEEDLRRTVSADGLLCVWNGELTFGTPGEATLRYDTNGFLPFDSYELSQYGGPLPSILVTTLPMEKQSDWFLACFDEVYETVEEACQRLQELLNSSQDEGQDNPV